jgi:predicted aspartyl protease
MERCSLRIPIRFVDASGQPTDDHIYGWPVVDVEVEVGFQPPADDNEMFVPKFKRIQAVIDTGADETVVSHRLAAGAPILHVAKSHSMLGAGYTDVHQALILIVGDESPTSLQVGVAPLKSMEMVLGRNLMSKFKLVLDWPTRSYYLEKPTAA